MSFHLDDFFHKSLNSIDFFSFFRKSKIRIFFKGKNCQNEREIFTIFFVQIIVYDFSKNILHNSSLLSKKV